MKEIRLIIDPNITEIVAYVLLEDGWHTKTFHSSIVSVISVINEGFNAHYGDDPRDWVKGEPE